MKAKTAFTGPVSFLSAALLIIAASAVPCRAQEAKAALFRDAKHAMEQAEKMNSRIFSPGHFEEALKNYERAEEDYTKGKNLEDIRKRLKLAEVYFLKAVETTKIVQNSLPGAVAARKDALEAQAPVYRKEQWEEASELFTKAVETVEDGDLEKARDRASGAADMYRQVELESIKANYLDETRKMLETAERRNVDKRAPLSITRARDFVNRAENLLSENRYDTDEARQLAREAKYEVEHALYLSGHIQTLEQKDETVESVILDAERNIQTVADALNFKARFHRGYTEPVDKIVTKIDSIKTREENLQQSLADTEEQVRSMRSRLTALESQLGDLKTKEESLSKIMEKQERDRELFNTVKALFTDDEAKVQRVGDQVTIRLYGLTFDVGTAVIKPEYFSLLGKVIKAIAVYPSSAVQVEGHTDSWGNDELNAELSRKRADAVREYIIASTDMDETQIEAVGYGESRPIATNETKEGRRKNRRIDIVIRPAGNSPRP